MQVICKNCQGVLQVDSKSRGKKTRCGHCNHVFEIVDPKQVAADKKAKRAADAKAKKAKRAAEAKTWQESIKQMPELLKREFKKKPIANNPVKQAANFKIHGNSGFTRFILGSAETFIQVIFWLVTAGYILFLGFSFLALLSGWDGVPEDLKEAVMTVQITFWITTAISYIVFFIGYVLIATPILALVSIERNTRTGGN